LLAVVEDRMSFVRCRETNGRVASYSSCSFHPTPLSLQQHTSTQNRPHDHVVRHKRIINTNCSLFTPHPFVQNHLGHASSQLKTRTGHGLANYNLIEDRQMEVRSRLFLASTTLFQFHLGFYFTARAQLRSCFRRPFSGG
jgi:hypothetical protein